ncbi:MAG: 4Fe-4S binding protein [Alphaproteobacteria bacterium]|jgi:iron only hydrogenase large subunit-like protein|nr:4Fe-4S binding protein [Alphaproteobacteria bacterium]
MSNREYPLYTIKNNCQDCYKCVRRCPVKAIKIEDGSAMIVPDLCIACGTCYRVCPAKAKQARNDLTRAKHLVQSGKDVYVSLAPSWITEFEGVSREQMIAAIRRLGFRGVSETALGAEEVSANIAGLLDKAANDALQVSAAPDMSQTACGEKDEDASAERSPERTSGVREDTDTGEAPQVSAANRLFISTACPAVVEYINKYVPERTANLTKLTSPLLAHCRLLKTALGKDIEVIFIGPCIAKKIEADRHPDLLSLSLSFTDLRQWLKDENIELKDIHTSVFDKFVMSKAEEGTAYPVEGGMIETLKPYEQSQKAYLMQITGIDNIKRELKNIREEALDRPVFIECLACEGGCVNGPCTSSKKSGLEKRVEILKESDFSGLAGKRSPSVDIRLDYAPEAIVQPKHDETDIKRVLASIGKYSIEDEINCGGCGYNTCRNFAKALLDGKAEPEMCVSHMKQQAQRKANALLRCIPSPIVIANARLSIMEYNDKFVETFWNEDEHADIYDQNNLHGADLRDFINFTNLFSASLDLEQDIHREHVRFNDKLFDVVVFNIDKKQIVGGIIEDVTNMEMKKEQIAEKAKEVIHKNLATVQQIACTLGEHMAETEVLLRSIAKDFAADDEQSSDLTIRTNSNKRDY